MLEPQELKWRRQHRRSLKGMARRGHTLDFGDFGLKAMEPKYITARQIEACRVAIARVLQRDGQSWIRIFPDMPKTAQPAETRMGKGKGDIERHVAVVKPGRILFEIAGVPKDLAEEALYKASHKLPIKTKFMIRRDYNSSN